MVTRRQYYSQWQHLPIRVDDWQQFFRSQPNPLLHRLHQAIGKLHCHNVLDIGCGVCPESSWITIEYHELDVTPKFVKYAHFKKQLNVTLGNALQLPFRTDSFDLVYCINLLIHLPPDDWKQCLKEMVRVACKAVVTIEQQWNENTEYKIGEQYGNLKFYFNKYGKQEVLRFMTEIGARSARILNRDKWQFTLYNLRGD